jgi:uncharacterized protein YndB with AHSA1/START domain
MKKISVVVEPGKQEAVITLGFDAPRELVFRTFTDPNLIPQWWGPRYLTTRVDKMEVKKGGIWRFLQQDANGNQHAFNGVYHEINTPERIVYTFEFEGVPGHIALETVSFEERDGMTIMVDQMVFQSVEDRDGMAAAGMEEGGIESMERFDELLAKSVKVR